MHVDNLYCLSKLVVQTFAAATVMASDVRGLQALIMVAFFIYDSCDQCIDKDTIFSVPCEDKLQTVKTDSLVSYTA